MAEIQIVQGISIGFVESGKLSLTVWPGLNEKNLFIRERRVEPFRNNQRANKLFPLFQWGKKGEAECEDYLSVKFCQFYNKTNLALQSQSLRPSASLPCLTYITIHMTCLSLYPFSYTQIYENILYLGNIDINSFLFYLYVATLFLE